MPFFFLLYTEYLIGLKIQQFLRREKNRKHIQPFSFEIKIKNKIQFSN